MTGSTTWSQVPDGPQALAAIRLTHDELRGWAHSTRRIRELQLPGFTAGRRASRGLSARTVSASRFLARKLLTSMSNLTHIAASANALPRHQFKRTSQHIPRNARRCFFMISFSRFRRATSAHKPDNSIASGVATLLPASLSLPGAATLIQLMPFWYFFITDSSRVTLFHVTCKRADFRQNSLFHRHSSMVVQESLVLSGLK